MLANRVSGQKTVRSGGDAQQSRPARADDVHRPLASPQDGQSLLGGLDVYVHRNYFGRQLRSFERDLDVAPGVLETADTAGAPAASSAHGVFIRAPAILETGPNAVQLAVVEAAPSPDAGLESTEPRHVTVAVRQVRRGPCAPNACVRLTFARCWLHRAPCWARLSTLS